MPEVLSSEEIKRILDNSGNIKHKAMLSLIYSAGLRIGETLKLRLKDIDSNRMIIRIRLGKEAMNSDSVNFFVMPRMKNFLETNGPWGSIGEQ